MPAASPSPIPALYQRLWHHAGFALVIAIVWLSLRPEPIPLPGEDGDKLAHFLAYAVLMSWFSQVIRAASLRSRYAVAFAMLGAALEVAQHFTGYRSADVRDALANVAGILLGWIIAPPRLPVLDRAWTWIATRQPL